MKKSVKFLFAILFILLLLIFLYSAYRVTNTLHEYKESDRYYEQARKSAVSPKDSVSSFGETTESDKLSFPLEYSPISVDYEALSKICPDIRAWLYCPDTKIDYPVTQSNDNDYYLHRLLDGTYNPGGTLFIDYRCPGDFSGKHTLIYGHNMGDGSMFACLPQYKDQAYYDAHPVLYLNTPNGDYRLDVFAGFVTWYDSRVYITDFLSRVEFEEWYTLMRSYSDFSSDVEVGNDDRIVTLSTCAYDYDDARYVLMAKLVPLTSQ